MITLAFKEKVRALSPIAHVVGEVIPLKGNVGKCPRHHDKHPSFSIDPKRGLCRCWAGCTDGSLDVFGFCMWYYGDTFPGALKRLARAAGMEIEESNNKGPRERTESLLIRNDISYQRWKRQALEELAVLQAILSQRLRNIAHKQRERSVLTKCGLERRLAALERMDEKFDSAERQ